MIDDHRSEGKRHRIRMLIPLWGAAYFERWIDIPAAALCSKGNLPYLQEHADFELVFLTKSQDVHFVRASIAPRLGGHIATRTVTIDEFFPRRAAVSYSVPLTLAFTKGVQDLGPDGIGTFVILMNADFILADDSLATLLRRIDEGYHIIAAPSLRVVDEPARDALWAHLLSRTGNDKFPPRVLMSLVQQHLHQTVLARIVNEPQPIEAWHYHLVYWRLGADCLAARYFLLHPFCFQLRRQVATATCSIDYGFLEQACPGGRYTALGDSDEFLMVELQARDAEAELLMPSGIAASPPADALEHKLMQIVANAGAWTTYEHRRGFQQRLLFHIADVSPTMQHSLSEFDKKMSKLLGALPSPMPRQRHVHWLGALRHYRAALHADGEAARRYPDLLNDDANRICVSLFPRDKACASQPAEKTPIDVIEYLASATAIVTLDYLLSDVAAKLKCATLFAADINILHSNDQYMEFSLHESPDFAPGHVLGMYLLIQSLPHWPKLRHLSDSARNAGAEVVLLFRNDGWTELPFDQRGWVLSRLSYFFSSQSPPARIEFISTLEQDKAELPAAADPFVKEVMDASLAGTVRFGSFAAFAIRLAGSGATVGNP